MKNLREIQVQFKTVAVTAFALLAGTMAASAQNVRIGVKNVSFAKGLIENLAAEYNKKNPDMKVELVNTTDADANAVVDNNDLGAVGKFVVLPIANSENAILTNKVLRKGINEKVGKQIFVQQTYDEALDVEEDEVNEKVLPGTVYSLSGSKAYITKLFAENWHATPNQLKGKKVVGREENVLSVVKQTPDAISFNVANLIYDLSNRQPQQGISILNIDLDGNGKVSDEEKAALANIDALSEYLNRTAKPGVAVGNITISSGNQKVRDFVAWAQANGQDIVAKQGFLKVHGTLTAQR